MASKRKNLTQPPSTEHQNSKRARTSGSDDDDDSFVLEPSHISKVSIDCF